MSCSLTSVSWCPIQRRIQECFWELRAGDIWEGADGSRGRNTWESGGDRREKAMGRGAKLLSGSGWQWAGSLQLWLAVEASCREVGEISSLSFIFPIPQLEPVHLLQTASEGHQRHWGQRLQRRDRGGHNPAGW